MPAARSIMDFRAQLVGSGARPNLFNITMQFPALAQAGAANTLITFMAHASAIPADKLGEIEVPFMGRKVFYPGDRDFDPWNLTVYNDENFAVHDAFVRWMSALNSHQGNVRDPQAAVPAGYTTDGYVKQYSTIDGPPIAQYAFKGAFPMEVGAITLDFGEFNTIEKFQVTLRFQWWDAVGPTGELTDGDPGPLNS